jgi:hypothetical protein
MQLVSPPALSKLLDYPSFCSLLRVKQREGDKPPACFLKPRSSLFAGQAKGFCVVVPLPKGERPDGSGAVLYGLQCLGDNSGGRDLLAFGHGLQPAVGLYV